MFKSVEYTGFEGQPELRELAEQATSVLASEIRTWREDIEVEWSPHREHAIGTLDLSLSLILENGISEKRKGMIRSKDFHEESWLASRCGLVWSDLLGGLIKQLDARVQESLFARTEV